MQSSGKNFEWNKDTIAGYSLTKRRDGLFNLSFIPKGKLHGSLYIPSISKVQALKLIKRYTGKEHK
jgi:hypothetical protein